MIVTHHLLSQLLMLIMVLLGFRPQNMYVEGIYNIPEFNCNLCAYNVTIILATGRSGSTTMLGMINQLPNYDIGGEHRGQFNALFNMYQMLEISYNFSSKSIGYGSAYYNRPQSKSQFFCWIQSWFVQNSGWKAKYDPRDVHGFKEFRYNQTEVLEFLYQVFPCAKYIINIRHDVVAQHQSKFLQKKDIVELELRKKVLLSFAKSHPKNCYVMAMEEFSDLQNWNTLFKWLDRGSCHAQDVIKSHWNQTYLTDTRKVVFCGS